MRNGLIVAMVVGLVACGEKSKAVPVDRLATAPTTQFAQSADPGLATDPATGDLLLSFVATDGSDDWSLYFSRSSDGGTAWSKPVLVATGPGEVHPHGEGA